MTYWNDKRKHRAQEVDATRPSFRLQWHPENRTCSQTQTSASFFNINMKGPHCLYASLKRSYVIYNRVHTFLHHLFLGHVTLHSWVLGRVCNWNFILSSSYNCLLYVEEPSIREKKQSSQRREWSLIKSGPLSLSREITELWQIFWFQEEIASAPHGLQWQWS